MARMEHLRDQVIVEGGMEVMYCEECQAQYSANKGDYFRVDDPEYVFTCCGKPMMLGYKLMQMAEVEEGARK